MRLIEDMDFFFHHCEMVKDTLFWNDQMAFARNNMSEEELVYAKRFFERTRYPETFEGW